MVTKTSVWTVLTLAISTTPQSVWIHLEVLLAPAQVVQLETVSKLTTAELAAWILTNVLLAILTMLAVLAVLTRNVTILLERFLAPVSLDLLVKIQGFFDCKFFLGDGKTCLDINECQTDNGGCDAVNGECINTQPGNNCTCAEGYEGDGVTCTNINECDLVPNPCDVKDHSS